MTYALRKLIAFVFLGGMFWFIYQDLDNLDKPWFMHALGLITIAFAFFWLLIPMIVFHEKGTLYIAADVKSGRVSSTSAPIGNMASRPVGCPSDVAFPGHRSNGYVCQRMHCYFTNRRIAFVGKDLDISIPFADLKKATVKPGVMVFEASENMRYAFTFQNPLVAEDVLERART